MSEARTTVRRTALLVLALALAGRGGLARADDGSDVDALAKELKNGPSLLSGLRFSGFADVSYRRTYLTDKSSLIGTSLPDHGAFSVGNLNLYIEAPLGTRSRFFIETRYTYLPNGTQSSTPDGTLTFNRTNTAVGDYTDANHPLSWGGVVIERAFLEYTLDEKLTLRAGQFLTPYGIWNVDHGSPAIISVARPYIVGEELIPSEQVGLEAYGTTHVGTTRIGYHATLSNGRIGAVPQYLDLDSHFGVGGRVFAETSALGELRVGLSGYGGRYTNSLRQISAGKLTDKVTDLYDELSLAADVKWVFKGIDLSAEYVQNHRKYKVNAPKHKTGTPIDQDTRWGVYGVLGYRLPFLERVMPYVKYEFYRRSEQLRSETTPDILMPFVGVNVHVQPNLVLKAEYSHAEFKGVSTAPYNSQINSYNLQASCAF